MLLEFQNPSDWRFPRCSQVNGVAAWWWGFFGVAQWVRAFCCYTSKLKIGWDKLLWGCFHDKWNLGGLKFPSLYPYIPAAPEKSHFKGTLCKTQISKMFILHQLHPPGQRAVIWSLFLSLRMQTLLVGAVNNVGLSETADLSRNTEFTAKTRWGHVVLWRIFTTRNAACGMWSCPNSTFQVINKPSVFFASFAPMLMFFKCTTRGI